jgi:hypothetical protein
VHQSFEYDQKAEVDFPKIVSVHYHHRLG